MTLLLMTGCRKNNHQLYPADESFINIWLGTSVVKEDSTVYNFGLKPVRQTDSVMFTARLMGQISDKDRSFTLRATGGDTGRIREGVHYSFGKYIIKANTWQAIFPVYILRTPDFKDTAFRIKFEVTGAPGMAAGVKEKSDLVIVLTDRFQKPANWDAETSAAYTKLVSFFGAFSAVKFQFITTATGVAPTYRVRYTGAPVPPDEIYYTQAAEYSRICKVKLSEYNAVNPALKDENGNVISF